MWIKTQKENDVYALVNLDKVHYASIVNYDNERLFKVILYWDGGGITAYEGPFKACQGYIDKLTYWLSAEDISTHKHSS